VAKKEIVTYDLEDGVSVRLELNGRWRDLLTGSDEPPGLIRIQAQMGYDPKGHLVPPACDAREAALHALNFYENPETPAELKRIYAPWIDLIRTAHRIPRKEKSDKPAIYSGPSFSPLQ
jgi:hypothetical protein